MRSSNGAAVLISLVCFSTSLPATGSAPTFLGVAVAGLSELTAAQQMLAEYIEVDEDLLAGG